MALRDLRYLGDPILRQTTERVDRFDADLESLIDDLLETMYASQGVGLAAPQVGDPRRVTVVDVSEERDGAEALALVNPELVCSEGEIDSEEGCLSIPGVVETVKRAAEVEVRYPDRSGAERTVRGTELLSRVLQHEIDHLEGKLFIDYLGPIRRELARRAFRKAMSEQGLPVGGD